MTRPEDIHSMPFMLGEVYERTKCLPKIEQDVDVLKKGHPNMFNEDGTPKNVGSGAITSHLGHIDVRQLIYLIAGVTVGMCTLFGTLYLIGVI